LPFSIPLAARCRFEFRREFFFQSQERFYLAGAQFFNGEPSKSPPKEELLQQR
jgi:hypothetical protein